ncbi:MAG TPA: GNAT family N-acetyltransferase [Actinocrinis sp.]|nr:GNAT family N-acetyltransferase [Actinocrinis sp.]
MTHTDTQHVELKQVGRDEAARIAAGEPGPEDRWAEGFPRQDDADPAKGLAAAEQDPAPFGVYALVPRSHGLMIGTAGFYGPPDPAGEVTIGYGMVEPEWGQGYGTRAVAGLVEVCRAHDGVSAINADTDLDNVGSQRVLEKNGFQRIRTTATQHFYRLRLKD